ncbi:class I SAM-dependent methyltransferase [Candidatus Methylacidiphilum infernorum]|uniref:Class I SAM-dependent methyltransferase n=1 Tax=Candidatus Methylacidiphilum infernorum TaxID=511746 RepID=A0ABX7PWQ6_9BACT|nr:class I SAM-dependent methyltransferase [Candidatus Methylacidiphilum infernorum]QSR87455.1 class I SAM-dependent methyltransferase [Candidatus Methylacidiphilum infernorum]
MQPDRFLLEGNELISTLQALNVAYLGISMGVFKTLHKEGALSFEELQQKTAVDAEYLRRFCLAAYAFGFMDEKNSFYVLSPLGTLFVDEKDRHKALPLALQSVFYPLITSQVAKLSKTGGHVHAFPPFEDAAVFPFMWTMMEEKFSVLFQKEIIPRLAFVEEIGPGGGIVVDVGCGNGWLLRALLTHFQTLRGLGIDSSQEGIAEAQKRAGGLKDRVQFVVADFFEYPLPQQVSLFTFSRSLHHLWSSRSRLVEKLKSALNPHSKVLVWEPVWPEKLEQLREENRQALAFQNLHEFVEGNQLLRENQIETFLEECGLNVQKFVLDNGTDFVFVGSKD